MGTGDGSCKCAQLPAAPCAPSGLPSTRMPPWQCCPIHMVTEVPVISMLRAAPRPRAVPSAQLDWPAKGRLQIATQVCICQKALWSEFDEIVVKIAGTATPIGPSGAPICSRSSADCSQSRRSVCGQGLWSAIKIAAIRNDGGAYRKRIKGRPIKIETCPVVT